MRSEEIQTNSYLVCERTRSEAVQERICERTYLVASGVQTQTVPSVGAGQQTDPQVYVELARGLQCPLDIVVCVDSSVSVGQEGFDKSVTFLDRLVKELDFPPLQMGIIRFNHLFQVICDLTSDLDVLTERIRSMKYVPGETKLAPALNCAASMLQVASMSTEDYAQEDTIRSKAIVVITDGDPNDPAETELEAQVLKSYGVQILFVQIGKIMNLQSLHRMASTPTEKCVVRLQAYDDLPEAFPLVLRNMVQVSLWVRRAKCVLDLSKYHEVPDINAIEGYEVAVHGSEPIARSYWSWEATRARYVQDSRIVPWEPFRRKALELVLPESRSVACQTLQALRVDSRTQTSAKITADAGLQTLPTLRSSIGSQTISEVSAISTGNWMLVPDSRPLEVVTTRSIPTLSEPIYAMPEVGSSRVALNLEDTELRGPNLQLAETLPSGAPAGSLAFTWDNGSSSHLAVTRVELQVWTAKTSDVARLLGISMQVRGLGSSAAAVVPGARVVCPDEVILGVADLQAKELLMHKVVPAHIESQAPALLLVNGLTPLAPVVLRARLIGSKAIQGAWGPPLLVVPLGPALSAWDARGGANITAALRSALESVQEAPRDIMNMTVQVWR